MIMLYEDETSTMRYPTFIILAFSFNQNIVLRVM